MILRGRINFPVDGMSVSMRGMITPATMMETHTDNIAHFGIPGFQKKETFLVDDVSMTGLRAVKNGLDARAGRIRRSGNATDVALMTPGYLQKQGPNGIERTRDGRLKLDGDGYLVSQDNKKLLSTDGLPIQLPRRIDDFEKQFQVALDGTVTLFNPKNGEVLPLARLSVVNEQDQLQKTIEMRQFYVEDSNVMLQEEFARLMPKRRAFEANRQLFIIQSDALSRMIQELGRNQ
jgi:flagellar basal body rod protein FlgG